jgi:hypothetical protein
MASNYLRQVLGFIGISDVNMILAVRTLAADQGHRPLQGRSDAHGSPISQRAFADLATVAGNDLFER